MSKILIVDDEADVEPMIRQRFRRAVRAGKIELYFAQDGAQALQIMETSPDIALIITDINMPRMDGLTLLERLSDRPDLPVKSIIVSAYGDIANIRAGMNRGAFDFVMKPIAFDDLELTMTRALDKVRTERLAREAHARVLEVQKEFEWARRVQMGILPRPWPRGAPEDLIGFMRSAQEVGGDAYDFFQIDDHHIGFAIADVAGKGIAAAIMAAVTHALLRALAMDLHDPAACVTKLNKFLTAHNPEMLFVTLIYCVLDRRTGIVSYINAGHPRPLKIGHDGDVTPLSGDSGIPIGITESTGWTTASLRLESGDRLFLFTDGLTEAANESGALFGHDRLRKHLQRLAQEKSNQLMRQLIAEIDEFRGPAPEPDDMTCLMLNWREPAPRDRSNGTAPKTAKKKTRDMSPLLTRED
jgi:sigma-B regulation protein RsbU (phosphoserine phosphatase)